MYSLGSTYRKLLCFVSWLRLEEPPATTLRCIDSFLTQYNRKRKQQVALSQQMKRFSDKWCDIEDVQRLATHCFAAAQQLDHSFQEGSGKYFV